MGGRRASLWAVAAFALGASTARGETQVIDSPTAQVLGHGQLRLELGAGPEGSVLAGARVGLIERFDFGISYGMQEVLGRGPIDVNPRPGVQLRALVLDSPGLPAVAFGFDSQGHGRWLRDKQRYERKSPGFFAVATQNLLVTSYEILTSLSGGVGYSLEPNRQSIDLFVGATQQLGRGIGVVVDYDFGLDDNANLDADRGYLDLGMQWRFGSGNHLRFLLRDLFGNYEGQGRVARELGFYYLLQL